MFKSNLVFLQVMSVVLFSLVLLGDNSDIIISIHLMSSVVDHNEQRIACMVGWMFAVWYPVTSLAVWVETIVRA